MDRLVLGKRIQEQRLLQELTQEKLGAMVGVLGSTISLIELGKKTPGMETFIKIVNSLSIPADILLRDEVVGGKPFIFNEITEKLKDLSPAQLKMVSEVIDAIVSNFQYIEQKEV